MLNRSSSTKTRDAVALLVLLGTFLVMPPILAVVNQPTTVFSLPTIVVYVFAVWGALIVCTRLVALRAGRPGAGDDERLPAGRPFAERKDD
ncbi:MAG: hypothetical protein RLO01_05310 [Thalassobaculaceae bacterium]